MNLDKPSDNLSNPYQAPMSQVSASASPALEIASKGRRFGTFVLDYTCYLLFSVLVGFVIGVVFGERGAEAMESVPEMLFGGGLLLVYYIFFEGLWGRTPGKLAFGTVVIDENGGPVSFGQVLGRTLCRLIPFEPFSFFGRQGWHDSISKTRVVRVR